MKEKKKIAEVSGTAVAGKEGGAPGIAHGIGPGIAPGSTAAALRLRQFHDALLDAFGPQRWWPAQKPFEVVVGAYLTQNTSWRCVELSLANLNAHGLLSVEGLRSISAEALQPLLRPSGFMIRKAAALKAFVAFLDREFDGSLELLAAHPAESLRPRLLELPGVGDETADAILLYALHRPAMVVDEYLRRIVTRHGLAPAGWNYARLQQFAASAFDGIAESDRIRSFNEFHALVVAVGKGHCRRVAHCEDCPLARFL